MEWEIYELEKDEKGYWFYSEGPRGRVRKVIEFQWVRCLGSSTFNLAFGDFKDGADRMDDRSISNNHDRLKVLHTVATAVIYFLQVSKTKEKRSDARPAIACLQGGRQAWNWKEQQCRVQ